jgi:hypothetical protein
MYLFNADRERLIRNRLEIVVRVADFHQLYLKTSLRIRVAHSFRLAEQDQRIPITVEYESGWIICRYISDRQLAHCQGKEGFGVLML